MPDRDKTVSRLQIIRTWAEVGKTSDGIQGEGCLKDVVDWIDDALELLKKQAEAIRELREDLGRQQDVCRYLMHRMDGIEKRQRSDKSADD